MAKRKTDDESVIETDLTEQTEATDEELFDPLEADPEVEGEAPSVTEQVLMRVTEALEKISQRQEAGPIPQIPFAKAKIKTPWNPSGNRLRPKLIRKIYLNGHRLQEARMSDDEIRLFNQLKPGKYHNRQWRVIETDTDKEGSALSVFLPNKTPEQQFELKANGPHIADILRKIIAEQTSITLG